MSQYIPNPPPFGSDVEALKRWMSDELNRLARCQSEPQDRLRLKVLHAEPEKYANGDVVEADGTDWNPGSGAGTYTRRGSWTKLG